MARWRSERSTYSIDALQEGISKNVEVHSTAGLYAAIDHSIARVGKAKILLLNSELFVTDSEGHNWELAHSGVCWEQVTLLS